MRIKDYFEHQDPTPPPFEIVPWDPLTGETMEHITLWTDSTGKLHYTIEVKLRVKYPQITVQLSGTDGNAFFILGAMQKALKRAKIPPEEIDQFREEAMSGDYDHLLQTCMKWAHVA
jgi:hypothetical protein